MNPFDKMVQNKRGKMLILAILLTVGVLIKQSNSINLTYIVQKEGDNLQPSCIAEENERYSAIGWIYPLPSKEEDKPDLITKFIPSIQNDYNCKFSKNDKCNKIWSIRNWEIDENSTRTLDLTFDSRWEDFPTIFTGNGGKEFKDRIEIPNVFRTGFSLRTSDNVELLICEGWNPYNYPCYHLNMSKNAIFLRKYMTLSKNISSSDTFLDSYTAVANILSGDEWRNFVVNLDDDGILTLSDVHVNRTVIQYEDKKPLKPLYLLVRSFKPTLWKIHQNNFLYTKTAQISRLGPILNLPSKSLCVSLYVSTCENCAMSFFIMKEGKTNERKYLKEVFPTQDSEWKLIKLKDEQILNDKLNIYVETKFLNGSANQTGGFWAIDEVRVCHENEVKVTFLKLKGKEEIDEVSCQVVQHPQWRPKKLVYSKIKDFPLINNTVNSTSITLNWTQEDSNNQINYFITYQANDLCPSEPFNLKRIKSNGFLMTKHNEIIINDLVSYTKYNITFTSVLHEAENNLQITTLESELPTSEELPSRLQIHPTDTEAFISWDTIDCRSIYGHILYSVQVVNVENRIVTELEVQTGNTVTINDLQPFTLYTFKIVTSRTFENIQNIKKSVEMSMNFTTKAGLAPPIRNLEAYSVDKNSVSFRYDLPTKAKGTPEVIQLRRCSNIVFNKCKSYTSKISRCKLWNRKYCLDVENLIPNQFYNFNISIKNSDTHLFGEEVKMTVLTQEQVPGRPTNLTYKMVDCQNILDYCHLNISWLHPYKQNGTITSFHIILNGTDQKLTKNIAAVMPISNKTYLPRYEYQIKYIPYSTHYELYVQSVNYQYKSNFVTIHIKTDDIGQHINQSPNLTKLADSSVTFTLPHLDPRLKSYMLTVVVQDFDRKQPIPRDISKMQKVSDHLCHNFGNSWVLPTVEVNNSTVLENFIIGSEDQSNKYLEPNTQYCITFIVTNKYQNSEHDVVYYKKLQTLETSTEDTETSGSNQFNHLYILLVLLLFVPVGFFLYRYLKKRKPRPKQEENKENVYESLPFEECEENCVSNDTYDHLLHK